MASHRERIQALQKLNKNIKEYDIQLGLTPNTVDLLPSITYEDDLSQQVTPLGVRSRRLTDAFDPLRDNPFDYVAERQSTAGKLASIPLKFTAIATTSFLDSFVGTAWGGVEALLTWDENRFVDNKFTQTMLGIQDFVEETLPFHRYYKEDEIPWYDRIFNPKHMLNFWGDVVVNQGFTAGTIAAMALGGGLLRAAGKATMKGMGAYKASRGLYAASATDSLKPLTTALKSGKLNPVQLNQELLRAGQNLKRLDLAAQRLATVYSSAGYARIESMQHSQIYKQEALSELSQFWDDNHESLRNEAKHAILARNPDISPNDLERQVNQVLAQEFTNASNQILEAADAQRNLTFGLDLFYLTLTNSFLWGKFASGNYGIAQTLGRMGARAKNMQNLRSGFTAVTLSPIQRYSLAGRNIFKVPLTQFAEESFLHINREGTSNFYSQIYDEEATRDLTQFRETYLEKLTETFTDVDNWESGMMGFIGGFLGGIGPNIQRGKFVGFTGRGGAWEIRSQLRNAALRNAINEKNTQMLNEKMQDGRLQEMYRGAIRRAALDRKGQQALLFDDRFEFENATSDAFISDYILFDKLGLQEQFMDVVSTYGKVTPSDARRMLEIQKDERGESAQEQVDPLEGKTDKQLQKLMTKQAQKFERMAEDLQGATERIEHLLMHREIHPQDHPKVVEALTYYTVSLQDMQNRLKQLNVKLPAQITEQIEAAYDLKLRGELDAYKTLLDKIDEQIGNFSERHDNISAEQAKRLAFDYSSLIMRFDHYTKLHDALMTDSGVAALVDGIEVIEREAEKFNEVEAAKGEVTDSVVAEKILKDFRKIKSPIEFREKMEEVKKLYGADALPKDLKSKIRNLWQALTGEKEVADVPIVARNKETNAKVIIQRDPATGKYAIKYVNEYELGRILSGKKALDLDTENLQDFDYVQRYFVSEQTMQREAEMHALRRITEPLFQEKWDERSAIINEANVSRARLSQITDEIRELDIQLENIDNRSTQRSIQKLSEHVNSLREEEQSLTKLLSRYEAEQERLSKEINELYEVSSAAVDGDFNKASIKRKIARLEDDYKYNEQAISSWKKFADGLKGLIQKLLDFFKSLAVIYNTEEGLRAIKSVPVDELAKRKKVIPQTLKNITEAGQKLKEAINQIESFEQANVELFERMVFLDQIGDKVKNYLKDYAPPRVIALGKQHSSTAQTYVDTSSPESALDNKKGRDSVRKSFAEGAKRSLRNLFRGLAGNEVQLDGETMSESKSTRRYFRFSRNNSITPGKFFAKIVHAEDFLSDEELNNIRERMKEYSEPTHDVDKPILITVFTDANGNYVNENGQPIKEVEQFFDEQGKLLGEDTELIYTALKTSHDRGQTYVTNEKKIAEEAAKFRKFRQQVIDRLSTKQDTYIPLISKSAGVPVMRSDKIQDGPAVQPIQKVAPAKNITIKVATGDGVSHNGQQIRIGSGRTIVIDNDNGNIYPVQPRKLNTNDINNVINAFKYFASQHTVEEGGKKLVRSEESSKMYMLDEKGNKITVKINGQDANLFQDFLKTVAFWTGNNLNEQGQKALAELKKKVGERRLTPSEIRQIWHNRENTISKGNKNAFHFFPSNTPGGSFLIPKFGPENKVDYQIVDLFKEGRWNKAAEELLREFLSTKLLQIDSARLNNNRGIVAVKKFNPDGTVELHDKDYETEGGYAEYLMDTNSLLTPIIEPNVEQEVHNTKHGDISIESIPQFLNPYVISQTETLYDKPEYYDSAADIAALQIKSKSTEQTDYVPDDTISIGKGTRAISKVHEGNIKAADSLPYLPSKEEQEEADRKMHRNIAIDQSEKVDVEGVMSAIEAGDQVAQDIKKRGGEPTRKAVQKTPPTTPQQGIPAIEADAAVRKDIQAAEKEKPEKAETWRPDKEDIAPFRMVTSNVYDGPENIAKMREWVKRVFGSRVNFNVQGDLISVDGRRVAYGKAKWALITLYENAEVGTTFHEAYHITSMMFLTDRERSALFSEYKQRTGQKELNFVEVEEFLAEDFRSYMLGTRPAYLDAKEYSNPIMRWFAKLKRFLFGLPTISQVFERIKDGYYADKPLMTKREGEYARSIIPGVDATNAMYILEGVNSQFFDKIYQNPANLERLLDPEHGSFLIQDTYNEMLDQIGKTLTGLEDKYGNNPPAGARYYIQSLRIMQRDWKKIVKAHGRMLKALRVDGIEDINDIWTEDIDEYNRYKDAANSWAQESLTKSPKKTASKYTRLLVASLPKVKYEIVDGVRKIVHEYNPLFLRSTVDFGTTFNLLINSLSGKANVGEMRAALLTMGSTNAVINVLNTRLGLNKPANELTSVEFIEQLRFFQSMRKHNNKYVMEFLDEDGHSQLWDLNQNYLNNLLERQWRSNYLGLVKSKFYKDKNTYNADAFKDLDLTEGTLYDSFPATLEFLNRLGIEFSSPKNIRIDSPEYADVHHRAKIILDRIQKGKQPVIFTTEQANNVGDDLKAFYNLEVITSEKGFEVSLFNAEGNRIYGNTLYNYSTMLIDELNSAGTNLFHELPHLRSVNNSILLERIKKGKKISQTIFDAAKDASSDRRISYKKLRPPDRLRIRVNQVLEGNHPLVRPSDNKIERFLSLGVFFTDSAIRQRKYITQFVNYLQDEITLASEFEKGEFDHTHNHQQTGILLDIINVKNSKLYKDILNEGTLSEDNLAAVSSIFLDYINDRVNNLRHTLLKNGIITQSQDGFKNIGLSWGDLTKNDFINRADLDNLLKNYQVNFMAGQIEQTKVFIGPLNYYKNTGDFFKRMVGLVGTKEFALTDSVLNEWVDTKLGAHKTIFKKDTYYMPQLYFEGHPIIRTAVAADVEAVSKDLKLYEGIKADEGDGFSYIHIDEMRRLLVRASKWSFGRNSHEEAYQREKGNTHYIDPGTGRKLWELDKTVDSAVLFNALKPHYYGPLAQDLFVPTMYKTALLPLIPSLIENRNLAQLNKQMELQNIGIVAFRSATKGIGTRVEKKTGKVQPLLNKKGEFNFSDKERMITQDTYYKYWGIQVDTGNAIKTKTPTGTQMMKQILNFLADKGQVREGFNELVQTFTKSNDRRIELGRQRYAQELGFVQDKEGNWKIDNPEHIVKFLEDEAIRRELPQNLIDGLQYIADNGVEVLPNRQKVENMLFALADRFIITQKRNGRQSVQIPATMFEELGVKRIKNKSGKEFFASDVVNFYQPTYNDEGEITSVKAMEVLLPSYFKGMISIGKIKDSKLLQLIGFRIPTQGPNSIESIIVKDFLPKSAGDIIVLPTDIVTKTGSDFDIDKLNIYIPNFYYNTKNEPIYIDKTKTYENYINVTRERLNNELFNNLNFKSGVVSRNAQKRVSELIDLYLKKDVISQDDIAFIQELVREEAEKLFRAAEEPGAVAIEEKLRTAQELVTISGLIDYQFSHYETKFDKILSRHEFEIQKEENIITEVMHDILMSPHNFENVINPISSDIHKTNSLYIKWLRAGKEGDFNQFKEAYLELEGSDSFSNLLNTEYMLDTEKRFLAGVDAIGVTAVYSTFHILSQLANLELNNANINLPHNAVDKDTVSLSGLLSVDKKKIANSISQWINAAVDATTDPFMLDLNVNMDTINLVLTLTLAGVPDQVIALFINQKGVLAYTEKLNRERSLTKDENIYLDNAAIIESLMDNVTIPDHFKYTVQDLENAIVGKHEGKDAADKEKYLNTAVLRDLLHYIQLSDEVSKAVRSIGFDTKSYGKNAAELLLKKYNINALLHNDNFSNFEKILGLKRLPDFDADTGQALFMADPDTLSFIAPYYREVLEGINMMRPLYQTLQNENIENMYYNLIDMYEHSDMRLSADDMVNVLEKFQMDLVLFVIMTKTQYRGTTLNTHIERLFHGPKNMAFRTLALQKHFAQKGIHNALVDSLVTIDQPISKSVDGADFNLANVILNRKPGIALESDILSDAWRNLLEGDDIYQSYAEDLIITVILQSGFQNSPTNFIDLIPSDVFHNLVRGELESGELTAQDLNRFASYEFFMHNANDNNIVPKGRKKNKGVKGMPFFKVPSYKPQYIDPTARKEALSKNVNVYSSIPKIYAWDGKRGIRLSVKNQAIKDFRSGLTRNTYGLVRLEEDGLPFDYRRFSNSDVVNSMHKVVPGEVKKEIAETLIQQKNEIINTLADSNHPQKEAFIKLVKEAVTQEQLDELRRKLC